MGNSPTTRAAAPLISDLHRLASGSALAFGGTVLGNGLAYLFALLIGQLAGAETVGLYFLGLVLMQLVGAVSRVGLSEGLLRFVAIDAAEGNVSRVKGTILVAVAVTTVVSIAFATLLAVLAEPLSTHILRQAEVAPYVRWMAATLPFFTVLMTLLNGVQALKRMDLVVLSRDILQPVTMIAIALALFFVTGNPLSFVAGHFGSMVIASLAALYFVTRAYPELARSGMASFERWGPLLAFSLPIAAGDAVHYLFRWSDTLLLSFFRSSAEVGVYNAALRTTLLLSLLGTAITALYAPIVAGHHHHGRHEQIQLILKTLMRWCLTLALPIVLTMCLLARQILSLWGEHFTDGSTTLIVLAVSQLLLIASTLLAFTLLMCGRQYLEVGNVVCVTAVNIGMNLVLIPRYGMTGAAIAMLASQALVLAARLMEVRHVLGLRLYSPRYMKPIVALVAACLVGLIVLLSRPTSALFASNIASMITTFVVVTIGYCAVLYALGLEEDDVTVWRQLRSN